MMHVTIQKPHSALVMLVTPCTSVMSYSDVLKHITPDNMSQSAGHFKDVHAGFRLFSGFGSIKLQIDVTPPQVQYYPLGVTPVNTKH